jgi:hypothetical protein
MTSSFPLGADAGAAAARGTTTTTSIATTNNVLNHFAFINYISSNSLKIADVDINARLFVSDHLLFKQKAAE